MEKTTNKYALFVAASENHKLTTKPHKVSTTYLSIQSTCPKSCELRKQNECYALHGRINLVLKNKVCATGDTYEDTIKAARQEASLIRNSFHGGPIPRDGAKGGRDLRARTAGDSRNNTSAKIFGEAAKNWVSRGGNMPWTYSHAWSKIKRSSWGKHVSVLASLDNAKDAMKALKKYYAPARYVAEFPSNKAWQEYGIKWIPCPAQLFENVTCTSCRLCLNDKRLKKMKAGIAFSAHGNKSYKMKERLSNAV